MNSTMPQLTRKALMMSACLWLAAAGMAVRATSAAGEGDAAPVLYAESYRPQFHFSPPGQWMNDPNGMVYYDGEYHLFYQYNPDDIRWGPMHWGHAVSADLVHWDNLPVALYPDGHGAIFSGSVVVDAQATSGFGDTGEHPALVAIFTYHDQRAKDAGRHDFQSQGLAYSVDRGRTWTKSPDNPVLPNPGIADFRDPRVWWYPPAHHWIMTLAVKNHVAFYSSDDLRHWRHESDFGIGVGFHGGVWECPDLIELAVDGHGARKAVLLVSLTPGGPNGGSATMYFVGRFDGHRFTPEPAVARWLDYGPDDYAGSTWSGTRQDDGRQIFLGWMSNWAYAQEVPTAPWRSAMTIPRELRLVSTHAGVSLRQVPATELRQLRRRSVTLAPARLSMPLDLTGGLGPNGGLLEISLQLETRHAGLVELTFSNALGQQTVLRMDRRRRLYEVDRSRSGAVDFAPGFADVASAPLKGDGDALELHLLLDHASLEAFINDGDTVFTTIFFPTVPYDRVTLSADHGIRMRAGEIHELASAWPH